MNSAVIKTDIRWNVPMYFIVINRAKKILMIFNKEFISSLGGWKSYKLELQYT